MATAGAAAQKGESAMRMRHLGLMSLAAMAAGFAPLLARAGEGLAPTETVRILDAKAAGDLAVTVRGAGEDRVKFTLENKTTKRLNVVIPPGLVAASATGQGFQSMGLGRPNGTPGAFGEFQGGATGNAGFRSVPAIAPDAEGVAISPGQTLEFHVPSVCLNFGVATPTSKNVFNLVDVDDYAKDVRVRKALKSLATLGTSQPVAQAVMWSVCNGLTFEQLATQKNAPINTFELAQAARFLEALDASSGDLVESVYVQQSRIVVHVEGADALSGDAVRLARDLEDAKLLGLPVRVVDDLKDLPARPGTVALHVALVGSRAGSTTIRVAVRSAPAFGEWKPVGEFDTRIDSSVNELKGNTLAANLDRAIARNFVTVTVAKRTTATTMFKVTNRLPMTLTGVTVRAGKAGDLVTVDAQGISPMRSVLVPVPAATAVVDHIEVNGL